MQLRLRAWPQTAHVKIQRCQVKDEARLDGDEDAIEILNEPVLAAGTKSRRPKGRWWVILRGPESGSTTDQGDRKEYSRRKGGIVLLTIFEPSKNPYGLALRIDESD